MRRAVSGSDMVCAEPSASATCPEPEPDVQRAVKNVRWSIPFETETRFPYESRLAAIRHEVAPRREGRSLSDPAEFVLCRDQSGAVVRSGSR
jgi:hypothetical protein